MTLRHLPLLACAILAGGCSLLDYSTKVTLASDPPGARVLFDDKDSGFVTPCVLELDPSESAHMALELPGYETAHRLLLSERDAQVVLWNDMVLRAGVWRFPMWLNMRDMFEPIRVDRRLSPSRIFVRLERTADK
jgi:hypothetical protein